MDSPHSGDERAQQGADAGKDLVSKKMKLLIIMLSLVIIILLLPLASDQGLPLLKPMGTAMLQRLWDAMRFIAMTAAISVGIISTSSQRNEGGSSRSAHLRSHRLSADTIASSSREPINPKPINNLDTDRFSTPNPSVDSPHQIIDGNTEMGNLRKSKGKALMDESSAALSNKGTFPSVSREEESASLDQRSHVNDVHSLHAPSQERNFESLKPRPSNSRRRLSASDAWFLALRIDEEMEQAGKNAHAMPGTFVGGSQKKPASVHGDTGIKSADRGVYASIMTDDNYAELRMRRAAISRLADEAQDADGRGQHRRSSSVDRRRPVHYDDQGPDKPGLKQILMNASKERAASKGKLPDSAPNVAEASDRPHSAHASVSSNPNPVSTPATRQSSTETKLSDLGRINVGANQILRQQTDSEHQHVVRKDDYQVISQIKPHQDQATFRDQKQRMRGSTLSAQKRPDSHQAMVDSSQLNQKQNDLIQEAKVGVDQKLQADTKMAIAQTPQNAEARPGPYQDNLQSTLHIKPNMPSRNRLLLQNSKHSRSELNLEQLEQKADTVHVRLPGAKPYERRRSFSYDFGDGFNLDMLWKLAPPPPPGFIDEQNVRTCPNGEADRSSFLDGTPKLEDRPPATNLMQELAPWRMSVPIDISAYPPRTPSPLDPSQGAGPSSSEVNQRADEFIKKFTTKLLRQRQESMERRRRYG